MFNIHYVSDPVLYAKAKGIDAYVGKVVSYQEGPEATPDSDIELGCSVLSLPSFVNIFDSNFCPNVRVEDNKLILIAGD